MESEKAIICKNCGHGITPSDTTALTEYRNGVLEEAAQCCIKVGNRESDFEAHDCFTAILAMKGKP